MRPFLARCASFMFVCGPALAAVPPPLPAEHVTTETLPPAGPHRAYVLDEAFENEIDSRVDLFDGDTYRKLGQIDGGFNPSAALSPDGRTTAVATTYFSRGGHGTRTDVVEFTDNRTLTVTHEIILPSKRAMTLPTLYNVAYSSDGHFLYVSYLTPAASFGVLDPAQGKVLGEIDTAGCVATIPWGPNRVSSVCGNGRLLTVTLNAQGAEASRSLSQPFFDPAKDPVFVQGVPTSDGVLFLSFLGEVREVSLSGAKPAFSPIWSLVSAAERGRWRPGGVQVGALQERLGRLYVPMHRGGEGSHKAGGTEIWVFDMKSHRRIARWPLAKLKLSPVVAVQVSQDPAPVLLAATDGSDLVVFDALTGQVRHIEKHFGQTPWQILTP
jgi:methylamine dehydrogenase heavy chain